MTSLDQSMKTIDRLIEGCFRSHRAFSQAASSMANEPLQHLFRLYAQQRQRFMAELAAFTVNSEEIEFADMDSGRGEKSDAEWVADCLTRDAQTLEAYRAAVAQRTLPTKARFLVSAQLALLEKVYNRMETLRPGTFNRSAPALKVVDL